MTQKKDSAHAFWNEIESCICQGFKTTRDELHQKIEKSHPHVREFIHQLHYSMIEVLNRYKALLNQNHKDNNL